MVSCLLYWICLYIKNNILSLIAMKTGSLCIVVALVFMIAMIPGAHAAVIAAKPSPNADFTGSPQSGYAPLTVLFNATSNGTGPLTWAWDFGDGSTENATVKDPVHTFANVGTYDVSLTVSNPVASTTTTKTGYITVSAPPVAPIADFSGSPLSGTAPLTVTFLDNSTGTAPLTWAWDFGDGSPENATLQSPVHTYANAGTYNVSLTVSNVAGSNTTTKTDYIAVSAALAPIADFSGTPQLGPAPLTVTFIDNSTGTAPLTWAWDFGDGSPENATLQSPVHTYANIGIYNVSLTVSNVVGSNTTIKIDYINVSAPPVAPAVDFSGTPQSGAAPLNVTFTDASTGTGPLTWAWDFGDGDPTNSTLQNPVHTYANVGTYNVSLTVSNAAGSTMTVKPDYITVSAAPVAPIADFVATPQSGAAPLRVTFFDNSTGTDPLTYVWDFDDGSTENATVQVPVHTYANAGMYNVSLTVSNAVGSNTTIKTGYITVTAAPVAGHWILDYGMDRVVNSRFQFGLGTDIPVSGDFNNDGVADIGVFRAGEWILDYGMDRVVDRRFQYGMGTDIPLTGDFNNDNLTDIGVFRSGEWILDYGMDRVVNSRFQFGLATDTPLTGDFNNDGLADIGVFRDGEWIMDYGMDRVVNSRFQFGLATDTPLVGNFNNDGLADIGVFRAGEWILDYGMDRVVNNRFMYGLGTDTPLVGNFNNDGLADIGVFRMV